MADEEVRAEETETPEEREMQEATGETAEEAHRQGEFEDLLARVESMQSSLADVLRTVSGLQETVGTFSSVAVDNGAEVREDASQEMDSDIADEDIVHIPDFTEFDLKM